jgi:hypothetical protein
VSFLIGQFSLLWIDQQQRLGFNVDVVESEWGRGADLDVLEAKLREDTAHTIKAIAIVHNETATGVTNDLTKVRKLLGQSVPRPGLSDNSLLHTRAHAFFFSPVVVSLTTKATHGPSQTRTGTRRWCWWTACRPSARWTSAWTSGAWTWR